MSELRVAELIAKLEKGAQKTHAILAERTEEQWQRLVYDDPCPWSVRDLLAHFLSSEEALLELAQNVVSGGPGAPEGLDHDEFNAQEQLRLSGWSSEQLLAALVDARRATVSWVRTLHDEDLERCGRHPALGVVPLEVMITAIYGHQLLHMRDLMRNDQLSARCTHTADSGVAKHRPAE